MVQHLVHAHDLVAAPEQAVGDKIIFVQAALRVVQQLPDLGTVQLVPRHGVHGAVGGVKLIQQVFAAENTLGVGAGVAGGVAAFAILLHILDRAKCHVGVVFFAGGVQRVQVAGADDIVRVHKGKVAAARGINAGVARGGQALVLLVEDPHALVLGGDLIAQLAAAVGGTVVHQQHFKRHFNLLLQDAVHALLQVRFGIVDRYDHTDSDMLHRVSSPSSLLSGVPRLWRPRKRPTDSR